MSTSAFVSYVHELHKMICDKILKIAPTTSYEVILGKKFKTFNVGDCVKKLYTRSADSFQILKKLNDNAYVVDLSKNFDISFTFNVENLLDYKGPDFNFSNSLVDEASLSLFLRAHPFFYSQIFYLI